MHLQELAAETLRSVLETLKASSVSIPFDEVWLFGSAARGEMKLGSDLDFLVIVSDPTLRKQVSAAISLLDVRDDTGPIPVDVIVRTRDYIENSFDVFSREVLRDRKLLWRRKKDV